MYYLLYQNDDFEFVESDIEPLLKNIKFEKVLYEEKNKLKFSENDIVLTYLNDECLRPYLSEASKGKWQLGILPHPKMNYITSGLGIPGNIEDVLSEIIESDTTHQVDLMYCNDKLVFQSVNVGEVFELIDEGKRKGFFGQLFRFLKQIRKLRALKHKPFSIFIEDEKIIETSALGLIAVEHSNSSLLAKKSVKTNVSNDGLLHLLILSPQFIWELIWYFFKSVLPDFLVSKNRPAFIGLMKIQTAVIKSTSKIDYTIDGEKYEADELNFKVDFQCLTMAHPMRTKEVKTEQPQKNSLLISNLPKGENKNELIKRRLPWLRRATYEEFKELFVVLKDNAKLTNSYLVMMILSTLITAFGLYADSAPVIIGAMILAPLISPIVSFSMGLIRYDVVLLKTSFKTITWGTLASLFFAAFVSVIIPLKIETAEIAARLTPTLLDLGIAVASGIAAAFAHAKEGIAKSLAGVAIAVALVPPLVVAGIGIGWMDWSVFSGAFLLYLTNLAGIIMFGGLTFLLLGFAPFKTAKKGLIYSLLIVLAVCVPLTFSFYRIKQEAEITRALEGTQFNEITLRDVRVRYGEIPTVSLKIIAPKTLPDEKLEEIKKQIEEKINHKITIEFLTAVEF
ncbi:TIGR00341 family protein [uncultured Planktosalinus sp.]|uniref:TIGR00341 family protein n=1 Tax=uncultured Planktosalinus sp. TaxID=1810935 RepID=UPI0030DB0C59